MKHMLVDNYQNNVNIQVKNIDGIDVVLENDFMRYIKEYTSYYLSRVFTIDNIIHIPEGINSDESIIDFLTESQYSYFYSDSDDCMAIFFNEFYKILSEYASYSVNYAFTSTMYIKDMQDLFVSYNERIKIIKERLSSVGKKVFYKGEYGLVILNTNLINIIEDKIQNVLDISYLAVIWDCKKLDCEQFFFDYTYLDEYQFNHIKSKQYLTEIKL